MYKFFFTFLFVYLYSFQLVVDYNNKQILKNCGINCKLNKSYCVIVNSDNKEYLEQIKYYLYNEYSIKSFIINNKKQKKLIIKSSVSNNILNKELRNIYSYQVASVKKLKDAKKIFNKIKRFKYSRIEKIDDYYVIRFGIYTDYKKAKKDFLKYKYIDVLLIKCHFIPNRVVVFEKGG